MDELKILRESNHVADWACDGGATKYLVEHQGKYFTYLVRDGDFGEICKVTDEDRRGFIGKAINEYEKGLNKRSFNNEEYENRDMGGPRCCLCNKEISWGETGCPFMPQYKTAKEAGKNLLMGGLSHGGKWICYECADKRERELKENIDKEQIIC